MSPRRPLLVATVVIVALVGGATSAAAHPFITDGATVPANSLASITLDLAHGCGDEAEGEGDPTTEVALEVPDFVSFLEPGEVDGYEVDVEGDPGGVPDVVVWTAIDGGVPAPALPMDVVIDGQEGDELYLPVFQACDDVEYRWIGTPDDPADDPAIGLTLAAQDPSNPPPTAEPEPGDGDVDAADDAAAEDDGADAGETPPADPADDDGTDPPADDGADEQATDDGADAAAPDPVDERATDPDDVEGGGGIPWIVLVVGAVVLAGLGALVATRRKPAAAPDEGPDDAPPPAA